MMKLNLPDLKNYFFGVANGSTRWGNGLRGFTSSYTHEGEYTLIGRQGALYGNITRVSGKFYTSEHAVVVTVEKEIDVDWISQKLDTKHMHSPGYLFLKY